MTSVAVALAIMDDLKDCLCTALADSVGGEPCYCGLYPGSLTPADWCSCRGTTTSCGMAWARLDRIFPSSRFPQLDQSGTSCGAPLAAVIELGVYRCLPAATERGEPPTAVALAQATVVQNGDAAAMHKALTCCGALADRPSVLGTYIPRDSGGCGGGIWPITVQLLDR